MGLGGALGEGGDTLAKDGHHIVEDDSLGGEIDTILGDYGSDVVEKLADAEGEEMRIFDCFGDVDEGSERFSLYLAV